MDLNLWNVFYEVAMYGNLSKASNQLHISQPALTKQIKNLEEHLDCQLFIRSQKGMILTKEGEEILKDIKNGLNIFENVEKKIKASNELLRGTIHIGIGNTLTKTFLMPYIQKFHKKYPQIVFEISNDPTNRLKEELKKGKIDFLIAKFPLKITDDLDYITIGTTQDIFIVGKDHHKFLDEKNYNIQDLTHSPILLQKNPSSSREMIEQYCKDNHCELKGVIESTSAGLLIEFVKIGYGIGVVTREYVKKELAKKEIFELNITPKLPKRKFGIIMLKKNYLPKCCMEFLKMLQEEKIDF